MDDLNELLQQALSKFDDLEETLSSIMEFDEIHGESVEDILYELSEMRSNIEDKIEK